MSAAEGGSAAPAPASAPATSAAGAVAVAATSAAGDPALMAAAAAALAGTGPALLDPATGEPYSKNALKRLARGETDKKPPKEAKPAPAPAPAAAPAKAKKAAVERVEAADATPPGKKKDVSGEMLPAYHPAVVEAAWGAWWEKEGFFSADVAAAAAAGEAGRFVMVIPPPNVTGSLHLGHALTSAVEDALTRWHRMSGRPTMWLPGTDHAGIATQTVVEKRLAKERGVSRHDLGREAFLKEVWAWKETYGSRITSQLRCLGVSADWSREAFTMDARLSVAVGEAFVRLHEAGLVYRDNRLVNWCCSLRSAISDIEVDYLELEKRTRLAVPGHDAAKRYEFGVITSFAYKVARPDGTPGEEEIVVATTRPETMLGDAAVAVHPADARYAHLHGARVVHPFDGRLLPIITDDVLVDMAFGTGAVKITPAHDPNDFVCGKKHGLEFITVFSSDGRVNERGGRFAGLMRFDAREAVVAALDGLGLGRGKADNKMRLGLCSRTGDVIEPLIRPQWYVKCDGMAKAAADAVRSGELKIEPDFHRATWFGWLDNIKDWCVSRQLWWGHRIPAYVVSIAGRPPGDPADPRAWVVARTEAAARAAAAAAAGVPEGDVTLAQDDDVLDTWFSSGLFPFSTFGWPDESHPDYAAFYPNTLLETGHDILFFWVARMVMMGLQLTGKLPFKTVYLHAMVRDKYGRKMSKSLGNVVDPLEVINGCDLETLHEKIRAGNLPAKEVDTAIKGQKLDFPDGIPECGADALRFGLLAYTVQGRDINLDIARVVAYRQFCNKLWNATRFTLAHLAPDRYAPLALADAATELERAAGAGELAVRDRWVLSRLNAAVEATNAAFVAYAFGDAATAIYNFFLYDFCDYYLELTKPLLSSGDPAAAAAVNGDVPRAARLARLTLVVCLDTALRLLHPLMPFVTEELWQRLPGRGLPSAAAGPDARSIMVARFPAPRAALAAPGVEADFEVFQALVRAGRGLRADADIVPSKAAGFYIVAPPGGPAAASPARVAAAQAADLATLLRASFVTVVPSRAGVEEGCTARVVSDRASVHLLLRGLVDPAAEVAKLDKKADRLRGEGDHLRRRMAAPTYADKVPADVREKDAEAVASVDAQLAAIAELRAQYAGWAAPAAPAAGAAGDAAAPATA